MEYFKKIKCFLTNEINLYNFLVNTNNKKEDLDKIKTLLNIKNIPKTFLDSDNINKTLYKKKFIINLNEYNPTEKKILYNIYGELGV